MKCLLILLCLFLSHPGLGQDDDEKMLQELEAAQKKQRAALKQIDQSAEALKQVPTNVMEQIKLTGSKTLDLKALMDPQTVILLKQMIHQSKLHNMSLEQAQSMIMGNVKGRPMEKVFIQIPKTLQISAAFMIDREALPSLLNIFPRKDDLKIFGWCALVLLVSGYLMRRLIVPKKAKFFKRLWISLSIHLFVSALTIGLFVYLFQEEVGPTLRVIGRNL